MKRRRRRAPLPASIRISQRKPRTTIAVLAGLLLAAVLGYDHWSHRDQPRGESADHARYHGKSFRVVRIIDGDTFDIDCPDRDREYTRIRLWGVDTPEIAHSGQGAMAFGPEAHNFAESTLSGESVEIELHASSTRDRYGRLLAFVHLGATKDTFNTQLIKEGYAYADSRFEHPRREEYVTMEVDARRKGMGMWASLKPTDMPKWRQKVEKKRKESTTKAARE